MGIKTIIITIFVTPVVLSLAACGGSNSNAVTSSGQSGTGDASSIDMSCDNAVFPSAEWTQCEAQNFARTTEAPAEVMAPEFQQRFVAQGLFNQAEWTQRSVDDASWLSPMSGNTVVLPLCTTWNLQCAGDPFRYLGVDGPDGQSFYDNEAEVIPVVFYDQACARISGRVWRPRTGSGPFPGVVIQNGSVQAPETLYWWAAQALVRSGYLVMTFDPRGQGRSDQQTPAGEQGSNANPVVFWEGLVNAIDFFRSTSAQPYPHNQTCANTYPTTVTAFNPFTSNLDFGRLGIAGHSLGGTGVSVVQSYGATGADAWPGLIDATNPVDAVVAWDGIFTQESGGSGNAGGNAPGTTSGSTSTPPVVAQFPILGQNSEYGLTPIPFSSPPDPEQLITNFGVWQDAGIPVIEQTIQGSSHYEWSLLPTFPATSWCPNPASEECEGGWGNDFAEHYMLAWFDRWLKQSGEPGFATADARLLDDDGVQGRNKYSFRYQSARDFATRDGQRQLCLDIRAGCQ